MFAVNYTNFRNHMKSYMDKATNEEDVMLITRKNNKHVVMLPEGAYNNLIENLYITGTKDNYDWLMEAKAQLDSGNFSKKDLVEVSCDE